MKPRSVGFSLAVFLSLLLHQSTGDNANLSPFIQFSTGIVGRQTQLLWTAQPGVRYRISSATDLAAGNWRERAVVEAATTAGSWLDPEPAGSRAFYRIDLPQAEVSMVTPTALGPGGGVLLVQAQCLPPGSSLVFEIEGAPPVVVALIEDAPGQYHAVLPAGAVMPGGTVLSARVVGPGGATVAVIAQNFEITETGRASDSPPVLPPATPLGMAINEKGLPHNCGCDKCNGKKKHGEKARMAGGGGSGKASFSDVSMMTSSHGSGGGAGKASFNDLHFTRPTSSLPGEISFQHCDLSLDTPAGPPIVWTSTYRSRHGGGGGGAGGWATLANIRIEPIPLAAGSSAPRLYLYSDDGRRDILYRQADGSYRGDGMFREGRFDPDTTFRLTFADKSQFIFCQLVGAPWSGRIGRIQDANGVGLDFTYDASSRLATVTSQFGQSFTCEYDGAGRLTKVIDHTSRFVAYEYYGPGEPGGSAGDLKSVSCPQLPGQPPLAGPTTYTYTAGSPDDQLNHNLLSITDGAGRLLEEFTYSTQSDPLAIDYDTCASSNRHRSDPLMGNVTLYKFEALAVFPGLPAAYRCIENDPLGRVTEYDYDANHRVVACREYTGFAAPGVPTTSGSNRPTGQLRAGDQAFYQTTFAYNADHCVTRVTAPDGTQERYTYGRELRHACPVRERGNAHIITLRAPGGAERTVACEFLPGFGTSESHIGKAVLTCRKAKGREEIYLVSNPAGGGGGGGGGWADNLGSSGQDGGDDPIPYRWPKGQKASHLPTPGGGGGGGGGGLFSSNPIPGVGIVVKRNPKKTTARMAAGGAPGLGIWAGEDGEGGCTDAYGVIPLGCGGGKGLAGGMLGRGTNPDGSDCTNHGRPKLGHATRLTTSHGQVFTWGYDANGNCTSYRPPITGAGCDATYNALGQCTSATVLNGPGSSFLAQFTYDAGSHWQTGHVQDPAGLAITTTFERDTLGRITRLVDPRGNDSLAEYDALDRFVVDRTPPVAGARISTNYFYDAGGLLARCDIEHRDATGTLDPANPAYSAFLVYDNRGRVARVAAEQRPVNVPAVPPLLDPAPLGIANFAVTDYTYDDAGQVVRVSTPAVCRGQSSDAVCDYRFDERGFPFQIIDGGFGALTSTVTQLDYDAFGACVASSQLPTSPLPGLDPLTTAYTYDGFHRLSSVTTPMGNVTQYEYDEQGFTTVSIFGELNDVTGSAGNVLLARGGGREAHMPVIVILLEPLRTGPGAGGGGGGGSCDFEWRLLAADMTYLEDIEVEDPVLECRRFRPAFFDVFVADDVWTWERFAPGAPQPHPTETCTVHRSPAGLPMSVTNTGDTVLTCTYDTAGRLATKSDGSVVRGTVRDQKGNVVLDRRTDYPTIVGTPPKEYTVTFTYDALDRLTSRTDGSTNTQSWQFDSLNRGTQFTDAKGVIYRQRWDGEFGGGIIPPAAYTILLEADTDGDGTYEMLQYATYYGREQLSDTNSNGYTTTDTRDSQGRLVQRDFADGTHESWSADPYGRINTQVHKDGTLVAADFDRDGRLDFVTHSGGSPGSLPVDPIDYRYDGLSRIVQLDQGDSHLVFTYDSVGNQLSDHHNGHGVTRSFNHRGRSGILYSDGTRFIEDRNHLGLLVSKSAVDAMGTIMSPPVTVMEYSGHYVAQEIRANGVVTTHTYRGDNDPPLPGGTDDFSFDECVRTVCTNGGGTVLYSTRVRRDRAQDVTQHDTLFTDAPQSTGRRHLQTFDRLGRLTSSVIQRREVTGGPFVPESQVAYTLDLEGRRLSAVGGNNPGPYTQSAAIPPGDHQMSQYTSWRGGDPLEWDDEGSLTSMSSSAGTKQFVYDADSRLVAVNDLAIGATVATYGYDAAGRRTRSTVSDNSGLPPVSTYFLYDGADCIQELGNDGLPNLTIATTGGGIGLCVISRNGTLVYPHGGGGTTSVWGRRCCRGDHYSRDICFSGSVGGGGSTDTGTISAITMRFEKCISTHSGDFKYRLFTGSTGTVTERTDSDDADAPIFLTSDGLVRPGATGTLSGYDWFGQGGSGAGKVSMNDSSFTMRFCPETGFLVDHGSVYSPQLGQDVSVHKPKPKKTKDQYEGWTVIQILRLME